MTNVINWFEIAVNDLDRAALFYETILASPPLYRMQMEDALMAFLPMEGDGVGGALCKQKMMKPSANGTLIYLNGGHDLSPILARVEKAGGTIVRPKTQVTEEIGFIALFKDTEGNTIGLHSSK